MWSYQDQDHQTKKELKKKIAFQSLQPFQPLDPVHPELTSANDSNPEPLAAVFQLALRTEGSH